MWRQADSKGLIASKSLVRFQPMRLFTFCWYSQSVGRLIANQIRMVRLHLPTLTFERELWSLNRLIKYTD